MKEHIEKLIKLQDIDDEASRVQAAMQESMKRLEEFRVKMGDLEKLVAEQNESKSAIERRQRILDSEVADVRILTKKSQDRLASIKNMREYKALQREIDDGKRRVEEMEKELLELLEKLGEVDGALSELSKEQETLADQFSQEKESVDREVKVGESRLTELSSDRGTIAASVPAQLFRTYQMVLRATGGRAVAAVTAAVCKGCNMNIPPQTYNELQRGDALKLCPHCERILYWKQEE
ncbi:MAG: C4-type zinc ribbon domain-containing protein [Thermodesulfobacteriota bacterium]